MPETVELIPGSTAADARMPEPGGDGSFQEVGGTFNCAKRAERFLASGKRRTVRDCLR
jgi:hypothetical protein